jgi:hypothetical protein
MKARPKFGECECRLLRKCNNVMLNDISIFGDLEASQRILEVSEWLPHGNCTPDWAGQRDWATASRYRGELVIPG